MFGHAAHINVRIFRPRLNAILAENVSARIPYSGRMTRYETSLLRGFRTRTRLNIASFRNAQRIRNPVAFSFVFMHLAEPNYCWAFVY